MDPIYMEPSKPNLKWNLCLKDHKISIKVKFYGNKETCEEGNFLSRLCLHFQPLIDPICFVLRPQHETCLF